MSSWRKLTPSSKWLLSSWRHETSSLPFLLILINFTLKVSYESIEYRPTLIPLRSSQPITLLAALGNLRQRGESTFSLPSNFSLPGSFPGASNFPSFGNQSQGGGQGHNNGGGQTGTSPPHLGAFNRAPPDPPHAQSGPLRRIRALQGMRRRRWRLRGRRLGLEELGREELGQLLRRRRLCREVQRGEATTAWSRGCQGRCCIVWSVGRL